MEIPGDKTHQVLPAVLVNLQERSFFTQATGDFLDMAHFDQEVVKRILVEELGFDSLLTSISIEALTNMDDRLQPVLDAWIKDRTETNYTFHDISIKEIMERENCGFLGALSTMNTCLRSPGFIAEYRKVDFSKRFKEGIPFEHLHQGRR